MLSNEALFYGEYENDDEMEEFEELLPEEELDFNNSKLPIEIEDESDLDFDEVLEEKEKYFD